MDDDWGTPILGNLHITIVNELMDINPLNDS